jgi:hypothetical protein
MPVLIAVLMLVAVGCLVYSFISFDRLVRLQHREQHALWEADGRPIGFFWRPAEVGWLPPAIWTSGLAHNRLSMVWIFETPDWVRESAPALRLIHDLRMGVLLWNVLIVAVAVAAVLFGR